MTGPPTPLTTGGSDEGGEGGGPGFAPRPDGPPAIISCSVWDDECPEGQKCIAWSNEGDEVWNDTRCRPVGTDLVGEACTVEGGPASGLDSCAQGSMCWGVDPETNTGLCAPLCHNEDHPLCDDPDRHCMVGNGGALNVCLFFCDPVNSECSDSEACYLVDESTVCLRPNTPVVVEPDLTPALCAPGSTAVAPGLDVGCDEGEPCCVSWCDLASPMPGCPSEASCRPWDDSLWAGDAGLCLDSPV
ncbi:MAG: hypothetical protein KUG77_07865 [Nannocystaceae bacterium]|nr:hypothetical protein [Nannocystaceae bacterium]